jgi:hypothetical protein
VSGVDAFSDLTIVTVGGNAVISWGTGDSITIEGVRASALSAVDFSFSSLAGATTVTPPSLELLGTIGHQAALEFGASQLS